MDKKKIVEALRATTNPEQQAEAGTYLDQLTKIVSFTPLLLQIVIEDDLEVASRQAGVIYLKNTINRFWATEKIEHHVGEQAQFTIHEQDRHLIRESIVDAIIAAPQPIKIQLAECASTILRHDFPSRWLNVVEKISAALEKMEAHSWDGALTVLYRLVKVYEYRKPNEKKPLVETMRVLLPMLETRLNSLMPDASQESVFLQKLIIKIFFALVQFSLNFQIISKEDFLVWMEKCREIVGRPVPIECSNMAELDRSTTVWWKCKKWAIHIMTRVFERYGSPGQVQAEYNQLAEFYLKKQAVPSVGTILQVLDRWRAGEYVSPRVLHLSLNYLQVACSHAFAWKAIKHHVHELVTTVIFPLLKHSDDDEEMWEEDPKEFIKIKYDVFDEVFSPSAAAAELLSAMVKRRGELPRILQLATHALTAQNADDREQDGALHMLGTLAPSLMKKKAYKKDLEKLVNAMIVPRLNSPARFVRSRAAWTLQSFSGIQFSEAVLGRAMQNLVAHLVDANEELPVKVESAMAIQMLLAEQKAAPKLLRPNVQQVIMEVLRLVAKTEIEDITSVMDRLIDTFMDEVIPIAVAVAQELANIFAQLLNSDEEMEERSITAMGILNTLESVLSVMEDHKEIMRQLEEIVRSVIKVVIDNSVMDFYEEIFSLVHSLTTAQISEPMWLVFEDLFEMFKQEGMDFFVDLMPALHNYVTVEVDGFLARPQRLQAILEMCSAVLTNEDVGEEAQTNAAKLLEVIVLDCRGRIDSMLSTIIQLTLTRLAAEIRTTELRTMCLQVVMAGLYYNTELMLATLTSLAPADSQLIDMLVQQMLQDADKLLGVHDRRLCVIAWCALFRLRDRPPILMRLAPTILPSLVQLFDALQKAIQSQAEKNNAETSSEGSGEEEEEGHDDGLASDEDEMDEATLEYLETISKQEKDSGHSESCDEDEDEDDDDDDVDETDLEAYETVIDRDNQPDEFLLFRDTLSELEQQDPGFYQALTAQLNESHLVSLRKLIAVCEQRGKLAESKQIEQSGGFTFTSDQVPTSFNFGASNF